MKKSENVTHNQGKNLSIKQDPEIREMMKPADQDF